MKITKKHKAYAVVLGLGFAVLGLDRGFATPQSAEAAPVVAEAVASRIVADSATNVPAVPAKSTIAARLQDMAVVDNIDVDTVANAFSPSQAWIAAKPVDVERTAAVAQEFARSHTVSAVMQSNKGGRAIIDGRLLRVGQVVDGITILSIGRNSVLFGNESGQFDLRMTTPLSSADIQAN
ncbi:MAG: hypothetical protein M3O30_18570 [Planctomycetota bacterium]|nr:hypothetical protein [Planctomycetota bacterium]